jgi:acyl-CoA dehydrogenase
MTYHAPVNDIMFALKTAVGLKDLCGSDLFAGLDEDTVQAVIEEAGKFGADVLAPLNWAGDRAGSSAKDGVVTTPDGWKQAYAANAA